jgi:hypothetical protein
MNMADSVAMANTKQMPGSWAPAVTPAGRSAWTSDELAADPTWQFELDAAAREALVSAVLRHDTKTTEILDLSAADVDLGAARDVIERAFREAEHGRGIALVSGLPRAELSEEQFALLTWLIGLHVGVARPQGKASQYLAAVRDIGTVYRSTTGRGYSSNA